MRCQRSRWYADSMRCSRNRGYAKDEFPRNRGEAQSYALQRNRCMPSLCAASGAAGMPDGCPRNRGEAHRMGSSGIVGKPIRLRWVPAESWGSPCNARRVSPWNRGGKTTPTRVVGSGIAVPPPSSRSRISAFGGLYSDEGGEGE